jgi:hypothetical protein
MTDARRHRAELKRERCDMTVYRSEQERIDEETGDWRLLDEIMESIRDVQQTTPEVLEALETATAKVIAQAELGPDAVEEYKDALDFKIKAYRRISAAERELSADAAVRNEARAGNGGSASHI